MERPCKLLRIEVIQMLSSCFWTPVQMCTCPPKDAFHAAAQGGHENVIQLLLDRGFTFREPLRSPLYAHGSRPSYEDLLRSSSPDHHRYGQKHEFRRKKPEIWKDLSIRSFSMNSLTWKNNHALQDAASKGHLRIVELILDNLGEDGARISAHEISESFWSASRTGHEKIVKCFLDRKLVVPHYFEEALKVTALKGHLEIVDILVTHCEWSGDHQTEEVCEIALV